MFWNCSRCRRRTSVRMDSYRPVLGTSDAIRQTGSVASATSTASREFLRSWQSASTATAAAATSSTVSSTAAARLPAAAHLPAAANLPGVQAEPVRMSTKA
jgi:hypothetical protein